MLLLAAGRVPLRHSSSLFANKSRNIFFIFLKERMPFGAKGVVFFFYFISALGTVVDGWMDGCEKKRAVLIHFLDGVFWNAPVFFCTAICSGDSPGRSRGGGGRIVRSTPHSARSKLHLRIILFFSPGIPGYFLWEYMAECCPTSPTNIFH